MRLIDETSAVDGIDATCDALGVCRSTYYRRQQPPQYGPVHRPKPPRALVPEETQAVLDVLHEDRFADLAPGQIYATLLDEKRYLCSERTMYRILAAHDELRERRNQLVHPKYTAPELLATGPNQLWSWDITKLKGPTTWSYYYLYVIIDVFSRYVVGWMVAPRESAALAEKLLDETYQRQEIAPGNLTVHADRGSSMRSKLVAQLLADLGVTKTHSRPQVSNDNPFSEAAFKTLKYRPDFPTRFGSIEDARVHCVDFFAWYNTEHYHSGVALQTPESVHYGRAQRVVEERTAVLAAAYAAHPERFVHGVPQPRTVPLEVWINKPRPVVAIADGEVVAAGESEVVAMTDGVAVATSDRADRSTRQPPTISSAPRSAAASCEDRTARPSTSTVLGATAARSRAEIRH
jgi:putative transposase